MINVVSILTLFALTLSGVMSHVQPGVKLAAGASCDDVQPFQSYHIHILFWQNNANSTARAESLLAKFKSNFKLDDSNMCKYNPGDLNETDLCVFEVSL